MSFVPPEAIVKPSPSIKDVVKDPEPVHTQQPQTEPQPSTSASEQPAESQPENQLENQPGNQLENQPESQPESQSENQPESQPENQQESQGQGQEPVVEPSGETPSETPSTPESVEATPPVSQPAEDKEPAETTDEEVFKQKWLDLIDTVFANKPTLHTPMKHYPVEIKDNIVYVSLKNELQQNDFEIKKTDVLQYLRANYSEAINDVVSKVDVNIQTPKFILDSQDKMNELNKQNPDFKEFIKILKLRQDE